MQCTRMQSVNTSHKEMKRYSNQFLARSTTWQISYLTSDYANLPTTHRLPSSLQHGKLCTKPVERIKSATNGDQKSQVSNIKTRQTLAKCPLIVRISPVHIYPVHTVVFDNVERSIIPFVDVPCLNGTRRKKPKKMLCGSHETQVDLMNTMTKTKGRRKSPSPSEVSHMKFVQVPLHKTRQMSRSIIKPEVLKVVLVADPAYIKFHNFKSNRVYQKSVMLRNISRSPARFQLEPRPYRSRFTVVIDSNSKSDIIPSGMTVRLIVYFSCDDMYEPEEKLVIKVQNGKPVIVKLQGCRDAPILRVIKTSDVQVSPVQECCVHSDSALSLSKTCYQKSGDAIESEQSISTDIEEESSEGCSNHSLTNGGLSHVIFECQKCFVGEEITRKITLKNIGGEARFFILSEIDWYSMSIEDITARNTLVLPTFAIQPAYFHLKSQEEIIITTYFFPDTYGMHVDTLFLTSDNSAVVSTEIMGDGVMYEPDIFQFSEKLTRITRSDVNTICPRYYLHLGSGMANNILGKSFCIMNTSDACMYYRWTKRSPKEVNNSDESETDDSLENFPLRKININPSEGMFPPLSILNFTVTAEIPEYLTNAHSAVLQFYVEDIPLAAIAKRFKIHTEESRIKRRTCLTSVDICVGDVEVWIQCIESDMRPCGEADEFDSYNECACCALSEIFTDVSSISQYWLYAKSEEILCDAISHDDLKSQLTMEEGFDHYEVVLTESIACPMRETIISMGILIPDGPLFVGIEQTYTLIMKNIAGQSVSYSWGQPTGFDESKIQICLCPGHGEIPAGEIRILEVVCLPIEAGPVGHLSIPCYIGESKNVLLLEIECIIESFHVTFYLPPFNENPKALSDVVRVEWHLDSYKSPLDLSAILENFSYNMRTREGKISQERELMSINLDEGSALKEAYAGPSIISIDRHDMKFTSFDDRGIVKQMSEAGSSSETSEFPVREKSVFEGEEGECDSVCGPNCLVPFCKTKSPPITESVIIEFLGVPLRTVRKRTIVIRNETPIPSSLSINIRNFCPVQIFKKNKMKEAVEEICKKVFDRKNGDVWSKLKQPDSGVLVFVEPNKAQMGPFQIIPVNIYVFADTWGVYTDEIQINITGIPQYTLGLCIHVDQLPITYPLHGSTSTKTPTIRFGALAHGANAETRKLLLINTSILPISINWYSFLVKPLRTGKSTDPDSMPPFSVILHMYTPFTDELAAKLKKPTESSNERLLKSSLEKYKSGESLNFLEMFDPVSVTDSAARTESKSIMQDQSLNHITCPLVKNCFCGEASVCTDTYSLLDSRYEMPSENAEESGEFSEESPIVSVVPNLSKRDRVKNTELDLSLDRFYGIPGSRYLTVFPEEVFIPPNGKTSVTLTLMPDKCPITDLNSSLICRLIGFIRIAPSDKHKHECFTRPDGVHLQTLEVRVEAQITRSRLSYDIPKSDRMFLIPADFVMQHPKKRILVERMYTFRNPENSTLYLNFEVNNPFRVMSISKCTKSISCEQAGSICVGGKEEIRIEISCCVSAGYIEELLESNVGQNRHSSVIKVNGSLLITHVDKSMQVLDLYLKVLLPVLNLSTYKLDFGSIHVGDTKKLILCIENHAAYEQSFRIRKKGRNEEFSIDRDAGEIPVHPVNGRSRFFITVSFSPRFPKESTEKLEILTHIPNYSEECVLIGYGSLDERYHLPTM